MNCCTTGEWKKTGGQLCWSSECQDWHVEIDVDNGVVCCRGDLWEFTDECYGTEEEMKAYALDVLHGVSTAVANAKRHSSDREKST